MPQGSLGNLIDGSHKELTRVLQKSPVPEWISAIFEPVYDRVEHLLSSHPCSGSSPKDTTTAAMTVVRQLLRPQGQVRVVSAQVTLALQGAQAKERAYTIYSS